MKLLLTFVFKEAKLQHTSLCPMCVLFDNDQMSTYRQNLKLTVVVGESNIYWNFVDNIDFLCQEFVSPFNVG